MEDMTVHEQRLLLGRYRVEQVLGGGMGVVYVAQDTHFDRKVAIKTIRPTLAHHATQARETLLRFEREKLAHERMGNHPNLVTVYDFTIYRDPEPAPYLVLEYVAGGALSDRLQQGAISLDIALRYTADIVRGLGIAHAKQIVHRDIKPGNIFLAADGRAQVGDFGIAQVGDLSGRDEGIAHHHPGTPLYMSPEQERTAGYLRPTSDQYSVGLVLYEMLTGEMYKQMSAQHVEEQLAAMPPVVSALIRRMTAAEAEARYPSMAQVHREIVAAYRSLQLAPPDDDYSTQMVFQASPQQWETPPSGSYERVITPPGTPAGASPPSDRTVVEDVPPQRGTQPPRSTPASADATEVEKPVSGAQPGTANAGAAAEPLAEMQRQIAEMKRQLATEERRRQVAEEEQRRQEAERVAQQLREVAEQQRRNEEAEKQRQAAQTPPPASMGAAPPIYPSSGPAQPFYPPPYPTPYPPVYPPVYAPPPKKKSSFGRRAFLLLLIGGGGTASVIAYRKEMEHREAATASAGTASSGSTASPRTTTVTTRPGTLAPSTTVPPTSPGVVIPPIVISLPQPTDISSPTTSAAVRTSVTVTPTPAASLPYQANFAKWATGRNETYKTDYRFEAATGEYHITNASNNQTFFIFAPEGQIYKDCVIDADVRAHSGGANGAFGIIFRAGADPAPQFVPYTAFMITVRGSWALWASNGTNSVLDTVGSSNPSAPSAVKAGDVVNRLTAICTGSQVTLRINGNTVGGPFPLGRTQGLVGVAVATSSIDSPLTPSDGYFANLRVSSVS